MKMFKRFLAWHDKTYKWLFGKEVPESKPVPKMADPKPKEVVEEEVAIEVEVKEETKPEILTLSSKKKIGNKDDFRATEDWRKDTVWEHAKKAKNRKETMLKRTRTVKGRYVADDKSTADTNEAWVGGKSPKKKKK